MIRARYVFALALGLALGVTISSFAGPGRSAAIARKYGGAAGVTASGTNPRVVTVADALNVGATTAADASNDFAFGRLSGQRAWWDDGTARFMFFNSANTLAGSLSPDGAPGLSMFLGDDGVLEWGTEDTFTAGDVRLRMHPTAFGSLLLDAPNGAYTGGLEIGDSLQNPSGYGALVVGRNGQGSLVTQDGYIYLYDHGNNLHVQFNAVSNFQRFASDSELQWSDTLLANGTADVGLKRDAANWLEVTNGSTGQGRLSAELLYLYSGVNRLTYLGMETLRDAARVALGAGSARVQLGHKTLTAGRAILSDPDGGADAYLELHDAAGNEDAAIYTSGNSAYLAGASSIYFRANGANRWQVNTSGWLIPSSADSYSIGGANNEVANIWVGTGRVYLGTSQTSSVYNTSNTLQLDGTSGITFRVGGSGYLGLNAASLRPGTAAQIDLGSNSNPWADALIAGTAQAAYLGVKSASEVVSLTSGASQSTTNLVPAGCTIVHVTARVTAGIAGATSIDLGDGSDVDRYGAAIGLTGGTTVDETDGTADPRSWSSGTQDVTVTANGGTFAGSGAIRITVFYLDPTPPGS